MKTGTKILSALLAVLMMISMVSGLTFSAGAAAEELQALLEQYNGYDADLFKAEVAEQIAAFRATLQGRIDAYPSADADGQAALISQSNSESEALLAAMNGGMKEDAAPRYTEKDTYAAFGHNGLNYSISTAEDWTTAAKVTTSGAWTGVTLHVTNDIDFENERINPFCKSESNYFTGTIHGHGHVFKNVAMNTSGNAGLVYYLAGTIRELGIESGHIKSTKTNGRVGALCAWASKNATVYKCWNGAKVESTKATEFISGLVGGGTPLVDSCYNVGQVVAASGHAHSLMGSAGNAAKVYNSIGAGTISAESGSMIYSKADIFADTARMPLYNTYAVGLPVALYDGEPSEYETNSLTINGHLYTAAMLEENYRNDDLLEVAAKINSNLADSGKGFDPVYYTLDAQGNLKFGSSSHRAVTVQVKLPQLKTPLVYYAVTGDTIVVEEAEGMVCVTEGVQVEGNVITAGAQDILVTFTYSESQLFEAAKERLQTMIGYYQQRNPALFVDWSVQQAWLEQAQATLAKENLTLAEVEAILEAESLLDKSAAEGTIATYPSVSEYLIYQNTGVKDFTIGSKADWLFAVAKSDAVALKEDAADFEGVTLHLIADIDMNHENMMPLCNGGVFNGNLDGHYYAFKNINITMENPRGAVGLIGEQGENLFIRNLGVESGIVKVTGMTMGEDGVPTKNNVGGILGIAQGGESGYIRNCWNGAEVRTENRNALGGIVGNGYGLRIMDGCFNIGATDRAGLLDLASLNTKIYNSFNAGKTANVEAATYGVFYPTEILELDNTADFPLINTYSLGWLFEFISSKAHPELTGTPTTGDKAHRNQIDLRMKVDSAKKAAYQINQNYVDTGLGERFWFTVDENGYVRFGTEGEQVRKVVLQSPGYDDEEVYAAAGKTVNLRFELDSNYFALVGDYETTTLEGNQLTLGNEDSVVRVGVAAYMGDANGNGKIELHDAVTILRYIVDDAVDCDIVAADVNYNAAPDANDAVLVVRGWLNDPACTYKPQKPEISEDWIKVVSYNIKTLSYEGDKLEAVADMLKAVDADIIGLQEVHYYSAQTNYKDQVKELAKALEATTGCTYYYHFASTGAYGNSYGHAIISKYPILSSEVFCFKDAPSEIDGQEPRAYSRHVLDVNGKEVIYYNTHLAQKGIQQLAYMMESSMEAEYDAGKYVLMTGDFNMYPWDFISSYDAEKFTVLNGGEDTGCFVETTTEDDQPIDNILVSENIEYYWDEARDCGIKVVDSTASDHSLIYSYIRLK